MALEIILIMCALTMLIALYMLKDRNIEKISFGLFMFGFLAGAFIEFWGVWSGEWSYENTSTWWNIAGVPFEILFMYGTGLFLMGILILCLFYKYDEHERLSVIKVLPILGIFFFALSIAHVDIPIAVGLTFLAMWGLIISDRQSIPIIAGICAFFLDIIVEGLLTMNGGYYIWSVGVALAFLLVAVTIAGFLTRKKCSGDDVCFVEQN